MSAHILNVYVYGGGDIVREIFNAIAATTGKDGGMFYALLRVTAMLAGTTALFSFIFKKDFLLCLKWFLSYYLVFYIMLVPSVTVNIVDRTEGTIGKARHVANVPLALGVFAHVTSSIGDAITQLIEANFSLPDDLKYSQSGMVMASRLALASRQLQIADPRLNENMDRYMVQCVYWPILLGHFSMNDLVGEPDLWGFIKGHAPKSRAFLYDGGGTDTKKIVVCNDGVKAIEKDLKAEFDRVATRAGKRFFAGKADNNAKAQFLKYLPIAHKHLLNTSESAVNLLQQSVVANAVTNGMLHFGMSTNSQTAVANYAATRAQEQQRLTQDTLGFLAGHWLPIMKNVFEAIMYGCFIFVMLLTLFPFGIDVLKNYIYTLFWLQTWAPLYAIINMICSYYAQIQSSSFPTGESGFILKNYYAFLQINHDMASLAGYLTLSVPFIAAGLVKGMASTMTHVAQYMGGASQSAGTQAASEAVAGNYSMGVTSLRNHTAFNTSSFQQDLRAKMSTGASYQLPGGEMINFMPDGGIAVDRGGTLSNLGVDINLAGSIHKSAMQQADSSYNTAKSESVAASEHTAAGMRNLYELAEHTGKSKSDNDNWVYGESASATKALSNIKDSTQTFADEKNISYDHAKQILSRVSTGFDINAGTPEKDTVGFGIGGKVGVDGNIQDTDNATERRLYNAAETFMKKTGYAENVDVATRALHDHSFGSHNEKGARLLNSTAGHFEKAASLKQEASTHFQEAQSYRNVASYAQDNAVNINVDASNSFLEHLANEPAGYRGVKGTKGITAAIRDLKNPEVAKIAADNFARSYAKEHLADWGKGTHAHLPLSGQDIKQAYQDNSRAVHNGALNQDQLHDKYLGNKNHIDGLAQKKDLKAGSSVDEFARYKVEDTMTQQKAQVQLAKKQEDSMDMVKEQKFKEESEAAKGNREHGATYTSLKTAASYIPRINIKRPSDGVKDQLDNK